MGIQCRHQVLRALRAVVEFPSTREVSLSPLWVFAYQEALF